MHHRQASYHRKLSVLQHLVPSYCFQIQFVQQMTDLYPVPHLAAPQLQSTQPPPQSTPTAPPLLPPPRLPSELDLLPSLPAPPHPPSPHREPTDSLSPELLLPVFSVWRLTSCKRLLQTPIQFITNVRFFLSDTSDPFMMDGNSDLE